MPLPPAGYGIVMIGDGNQKLDEHAAPIFGGPNVTTTTSNLAALVAFTRALQWARRCTRGPVCIRYTEEYAARIATGAWKAKKHKRMAVEAQHAWRQLRKQRGPDQVWMQHAPARSEWATDAWNLALAGKSGRRVNPAAAHLATDVD